MNEGRFVYIPEFNTTAEVIEQQLHQAKLRYTLGGFLHEEYFTDEDYEEFEVFNEGE